jgi:glycosyltransferase involved in cell wall biosynthesis
MTFDLWVRRHAWKELLKRKLFSAADGVFTPGPDGRSFALRYGAAPERVYRVPQVIDVEHYRKGHTAAQRDRTVRRGKVGLRGITFLYVGRLWSGKGISYLLEAFGQLQQSIDQEVSLLLVGDGVDETALRDFSQELKLQNVVFAGFRQKPELPRWYSLADVFVFPTLGDPYGLVVDEAMACSMPVITTTEAGEIAERVKDGVNGYVVPPEDSSALAERMEYLASDPDLRVRMGAAGYEQIHHQTPTCWAEAFEEAVDRLCRGRANDL